MNINPFTPSFTFQSFGWSAPALTRPSCPSPCPPPPPPREAEDGTEQDGGDAATPAGHERSMVPERLSERASLPADDDGSLPGPPTTRQWKTVRAGRRDSAWRSGSYVLAPTEE